MEKNAANEAEIASMKKDINDALGADYYDKMQALDNEFTEQRLGTLGQKDYALMQDAVTLLQEEIRDSNDLEYTDDDYEEVTKEFYEELLDEESGIDLRGRAVIDFVVNRLKVILEGFEVGMNGGLAGIQWNCDVPDKKRGKRNSRFDVILQTDFERASWISR
jgi:hypothetical protein